jgi:hypothetical protein
MSGADRIKAEDRVRAEAPAGNPAEVSDKAAVPVKAAVTVGIDGKMKKPGPQDPAFFRTKRNIEA